jgi:hypothetical protein
LIFAEFCEQRIGRRATGAAFGGEEFDDDGLLGGGHGLRGGGGTSGPTGEKSEASKDRGEKESMKE